MAKSNASTKPAAWSPIHVLRIMNPDTLSISCVGEARSYHRRCRNHIAQHNVAVAKKILEELSHMDQKNSDIRKLLVQLASYTICYRHKHDQTGEVVDRWYSCIDLPCGIRSKSGKTRFYMPKEECVSDEDDEFDDSTEELRKLLQQLEELRRQFSGGKEEPVPVSNASCQSGQTSRQQFGVEIEGESIESRQRARDSAEAHQREEIRKKQETEARERREEARKRREEEERKRQEEHRRQAEQRRAAEEARQKAAREREEREAKAKAQADRERVRQENAQKARDEEARDWSRAWSRYTSAWCKIKLEGLRLGHDAIQTLLPFPTKEGTLLSCSEEAVRLFFKHMPNNLYFDDNAAFRKAIKRQLLYWHTDKFQQSEGITTTVTMISQVLIGLM